MINPKESPVRFIKMHALGNDFMIIEGVEDPTPLVQLCPTLSHRKLGIGFDQLLILRSSKKADVFCQIFNADGSEAYQCGNGLRAIARFLHETNKIKNKQLTIELKAGIFPVHIKDYNHIGVIFPPPSS